jgi:ubiquinone/menaquinone biosynthesis C-methylase UbiE
VVDIEAGKARTRATYNLAADHFDEAPLGFWARAGERTISLAGLAPGHRVLDVCCGSGATAIPAAEAVGPFGTVLGVDLAESLLQLARGKAAAAGLGNVEFRAADIETLKFPEASCDAVVCQFGIFFLEDMEAALGRLWSFVAPGGALAVTTWGPRVWEPAMGAFHRLVLAERPDLHQPHRPWDRISTPDQLRQLFVAAGAAEPDVVVEEAVQALATPGDFWTILAGSGTRGTIEAMGPEAAARVRGELLHVMESTGVKGIETNMLYAVARKPV